MVVKRKTFTSELSSEPHTCITVLLRKQRLVARAVSRLVFSYCFLFYGSGIRLVFICGSDALPTAQRLKASRPTIYNGLMMKAEEGLCLLGVGLSIISHGGQYIQSDHVQRFHDEGRRGVLFTGGRSK